MEEKTEKCSNCETSRKNIEEKERTIKCSMCSAVIEDICVLSPGTIARFYQWTGTTNSKNGVLTESWYCQKHSIDDIKVFEEKDNTR